MPPPPAIVKPSILATRLVPPEDKPGMPDDNQTVIPRSFIDLFIPPGTYKPREPREVVAARYELCEDMAQMLTEHARTKLFELGVAEEDVLEKVRQGLLARGSVVTEDEAGWDVCRPFIRGVSTSACAIHWPARAARCVANPSDDRSGSVPRIRRRSRRRARHSNRGRRHSGRHSSPPDHRPEDSR